MENRQAYNEDGEILLPLASQRASEILTTCMSAPSKKEQLAIATPPRFTEGFGC